MVEGGTNIGIEPTLVDDARDPSDAVPEIIGRYEVVRRIGSGAMGTVYEARDPELARKVALKVLGQVDSEDAEHRWRRDRLRREAQALAQLSHENVVSVYDVGVVRLDDGKDHVYLSMQLVEGVDLAAWLRTHPPGERNKRDTRRMLDMYAQAGRGLAAAHEVGLVHRDFKPANVLIGDDGSVRVADFGLARSATGLPTADEAPAKSQVAADRDPSAMLGTMTMPGAVMGTPPYMAPEQFLGEEVDSRTDQFAFCVALYEGLYGQRPFAGRTFASLRRNVTRRRISDPPAGVRVPARLRRIALRGLSTDPDQRFPDMQSLVDALERDPAARLRAIAQLALVVGLVAAIALVFLAKRGAGRDTRCTHGSDHLADVWDGARKGAIRTAFLATKRPHAEDVFGRVARRLDTHFASWVAARNNTCAATHVRGEQSPEVMDLRMRCLDDRLSEAQALVALLGKEPDTEVLNKAVDAVAGLSGPALCEDVDALRAVVPPPTDPTARQQVVALSHRLDGVAALQDAGKYRLGLELAQKAVTEASKLGYAPVHARALYLRAALESDNGRFIAAEASYYEAAKAAGTARDDRLIARILTALVSVVGDRHGDSKNTQTLVALAASAVARVGTPAALEAELLNSRATTLQTQGKFAEAEGYFRRALALRREALGEDHPDVARSLNGVAVALYYQEKVTESETEYRRALDLLQRALGPDHPHVAAIAGNLGNAILDLGRAKEALPFHRRALEVRRRTLGETNAYTANSLHSLGRVSLALNDLPAALRYFQDALRTEQAALGADYPDVGVMMSDVADVLRLQGKDREARTRYRKGIAIIEAALGKHHLRTARPRTGLSQVERRLGNHAEAVAQAERAVAILAKRSDRHESLANARFALARALWTARRERRRALALASQARDALASGPGADPDAHAQVVTWLASPRDR